MKKSSLPKVAFLVFAFAVSLLVPPAAQAESPKLETATFAAGCFLGIRRILPKNARRHVDSRRLHRRYDNKSRL